jgi:hypothetical protein
VVHRSNDYFREVTMIGDDAAVLIGVAGAVIVLLCHLPLWMGWIE